MFTTQRKQLDEQTLEKKTEVSNNAAVQSKAQSDAASSSFNQLNLLSAIQRKAENSVDNDNMPNRTGLPDKLKSGIESLSGYSMDDVRVHYNSPKPAQMKALAYTQGSDINVAPGQEQHLPHEAWHIVQQKQGRVQPTAQLKGINVNDDSELEHEADVMGNYAVNLDSLGDEELKVKKAESGVAQAKLPDLGDGKEWTKLYDGIDENEIIEEENPKVGTPTRRMSDAIKLIKDLSASNIDFAQSLETNDGLRRLANDIKIVKRKKKDSQGSFLNANFDNLKDAQNKLKSEIKSLEEQNYPKNAYPNYINEEKDEHFDNMKNKAKSMIIKVVGEHYEYFRLYFNPNKQRTCTGYYNKIKDNFKKIASGLDKLGYKDNYTKIGHFGYVYKNPTKRGKDDTLEVDKKDGNGPVKINIGDTYIPSRVQKSEETGLQIRLSSAYRKAAEEGRDSKPGVIIHEASHILLGTNDNAYGDDIRTLSPDNAMNNADTYEYAAEDAFNYSTKDPQPNLPPTQSQNQPPYHRRYPLPEAIPFPGEPYSPPQSPNQTTQSCPPTIYTNRPPTTPPQRQVTIITPTTSPPPPPPPQSPDQANRANSSNSRNNLRRRRYCTEATIPQTTDPTNKR